MLQERLEGKWIECFAAIFERCKVAPGEAGAILSESQFRPINVQLVELALDRLGAQPFHIVVPTPAQSAPVPVRSTGASDVIQNTRPVVGALASTTLVVDLTGAVAGGGWGWVTRPGIMLHWSGGLCLCFPNTITVNGTLVLDRGDVTLTFKRYLDAPITLRIEDDYVTAIEGDGVDADLMRSYFTAWDDWDAMTMYDRRDFNGTELRAYAGNVVYSTGANAVAGRQTLGHFDLPIRNCTVQLDGHAVVKGGVLQGELV